MQFTIRPTFQNGTARKMDSAAWDSGKRRMKGHFEMLGPGFVRVSVGSSPTAALENFFFVAKFEEQFIEARDADVFAPRGDCLQAK